MTQAADMDPRFAFEAREWPNGHYVHTLAGLKEEPRGYIKLIILSFHIRIYNLF